MCVAKAADIGLCSLIGQVNIPDFETDICGKYQAGFL
jgi:hypothetical protein